MAPPRREQIQVAAVDRLTGIAQGAGYRTTLRRVSRRDEYLDEVHEFPIALLLPAYDLEEPDEALDHDGTERHELGMEVVLFAQGSEAGSAIPRLEDLEADVQRALLTPPRTLGLPFVLDVRRVAGREGESWSDPSKGHRAWRAVKYVAQYLAPDGLE